MVSGASCGPPCTACGNRPCCEMTRRPPSPPPPHTHTHTQHHKQISCFRIPSIVQTRNGTILAFAEARGRFGPNGEGSCADCSPLGIAVKRSVDGGDTWERFRWALDPFFTVASVIGNSGGNPVAVYDERKREKRGGWWVGGWVGWVVCAQI